MVREYPYIGPGSIRKSAEGSAGGRLLRSIRDLEDWVRETGQEPDGRGLITATFVVDLEGFLRVADRHSEHVACAGRAPVLSAGEVSFSKSRGAWTVEEISNQSTGYCPDPESWPAVASALDRLGIAHPGRFTLSCIFRRCPACGQVNIVKEDWYSCGSCAEDLPKERNI